MAAEHLIEPLLTEQEVAKWLNVSVSTLRRRRFARQSPEWIKFNGSVRYNPEAIRRFIAERERNAGQAQKPNQGGQA